MLARNKKDDIKVSSFESNGNIQKKRVGHVVQLRITSPHQ